MDGDHTGSLLGGMRGGRWEREQAAHISENGKAEIPELKQTEKKVRKKDTGRIEVPAELHPPQPWIYREICAAKEDVYTKGELSYV